MNKGQKEGFANEFKGRGLFYGVIAVAVFIIMAVGATFAYFTATTSSADSTLRTGSTTLELDYISYESAWMRDDLIPVKSAVVEYSFQNQSDLTIRDTGTMSNALCKDDFGNSICSVYVFQVRNEANSPQNVSIDVVSERNEFGSLHAMAYEISIPEDLTVYDDTNSTEDGSTYNGINDPTFRKGTSDNTEDAIDVKDSAGNILDTYTPVYVNRGGVVKTLLKYVETADPLVKKPAIDRKLITTVLEDGTDVIFDEIDPTPQKTANIAGDIEIGGGQTKTFALVLYILDNNQDQTKTDAEKSFTGRVVISSGDGSSGVSGYISFVTDDTIKDLQSNQTEDTEEDQTETP